MYIQHDDLASSSVGSAAASGQRDPATQRASLGVSRSLCATSRPATLYIVGDWSQVRSQQIGADFAGNRPRFSGHD